MRQIKRQKIEIYKMSDPVYDLNDHKIIERKFPIECKMTAFLQSFELLIPSFKNIFARLLINILYRVFYVFFIVPTGLSKLINQVLMIDYLPLVYLLIIAICVIP